MDTERHSSSKPRSLAGLRVPSRMRSLAIPLALATVVAVARAAAAQQADSDLVVTRSVVSNSGEMTVSGGSFELTGTAGQPSTGVSSGGRFELTAGFGVRSPHGDCDSDGVTGLLDWTEFSTCISAPESPTTPSCACFDIDSDGDVDLRDFARFQTAFNASR